MTAKSKTNIKAFFLTGLKPTQSQFSDTIDSYVDAAGPVGTLETALSANPTGVMIATVGTPSVAGYTVVRSSMGITVYDNATLAAGVPYATTAQAVAGTATGAVMDPVMTKNAITALGTSEVVLLGTATASASSTLDFTSLISSSYDKYLFVFVDLLTSANAGILLLAAHDNATFTDTVSAQIAAISLGGSSTPSYTGDSSSSGATLIAAPGAAHTVSGFGEFIIGTRDSPGYSILTSPYLSGNPKVAYFDLDTGGSSKVNAIRFKPSSGNFTSGTVKLYGVKNT